MHEFELWQAKKIAKSQNKHSLPMRGQPTKLCKYCGQAGHFPYKCKLNPKKPKRIKQKGKRTLEYEEWRDTVAIPYLDKKTGRICQACFGARCGNIQLDVDHILNRGSHYNLRMSLSNVQYLGREPCHREKTDRVNK